MMNNTYWMVLGFALLTIIILFMIAAVRMTATLTGKHGLRFSPSGEDVSPLANRVCRAHANCLENLPIVLAVVLVAAMTNQLSVTNPLAFTFLGFRVAQSVIHLISTSATAIMLRFAAFVVQVCILLYWCIKLLGG